MSNKTTTTTIPAGAEPVLKQLIRLQHIAISANELTEKDRDHYLSQSMKKEQCQSLLLKWAGNSLPDGTLDIFRLLVGTLEARQNVGAALLKRVEDTINCLLVLVIPREGLESALVEGLLDDDFQRCFAFAGSVHATPVTSTKYSWLHAFSARVHEAPCQSLQELVRFFTDDGARSLLWSLAPNDYWARALLYRSVRDRVGYKLPLTRIDLIRALLSLHKLKAGDLSQLGFDLFRRAKAYEKCSFLPELAGHPPLLIECKTDQMMEAAVDERLQMLMPGDLFRFLQLGLVVIDTASKKCKLNRVFTARAILRKEEFEMLVANSIGETI